MALMPRQAHLQPRDGFHAAIIIMIIAFVLLLASAALSGGRTQEIGDARAGLAYARPVCAECHGVLKSEATSPAAKATPFKVVANTPGMTGTAIAVWLRTPHPSMPNIIVAGDDLENLVAYILELKDRK